MARRGNYITGSGQERPLKIFDCEHLDSDDSEDLDGIIYKKTTRQCTKENT